MDLVIHRWYDHIKTSALLHPSRCINTHMNSFLTISGKTHKTSCHVGGVTFVLRRCLMSSSKFDSCSPAGSLRSPTYVTLIGGRRSILWRPAEKTCLTGLAPRIIQTSPESRKLIFPDCCTSLDISVLCVPSFSMGMCATKPPGIRHANGLPLLMAARHWSVTLSGWPDAYGVWEFAYISFRQAVHVYALECIGYFMDFISPFVDLIRQELSILTRVEPDFG